MSDAMTKTPAARPAQDPAEEMLSRVRRIETRLTQLMVALDITTRADQPRFFPRRPGQDAILTVPSLHSSIKEILDNIPATCNESVSIVIDANVVATIRKPG